MTNIGVKTGVKMAFLKLNLPLSLPLRFLFAHPNKVLCPKVKEQFK